METEEVVCKVGFETSGLSQGLTRVKEGMHDMGLHVESEGKAFKKVLHEITDLSPGLGIALRAALNPVVAIFIAAVTGAKMVHHALKEFEESLNKISEKQAKREMANEEAASKAADKIAKAKEAAAAHAEKLEDRNEAEKIDDEMQAQIALAHIEAGNDEAKFLRLKKQIELQAAAEQQARETDAAQRARALEAASTDEDRETKLQKLKSALKDALKDEETARKDALKAEATNLGEHPVKAAIQAAALATTPFGAAAEAAGLINPGAADAAAYRKKTAAKRDELAKHRKDIEDTIRLVESGQEAHNKALDRAYSAEQEAHNKGRALKKSGIEEDAKIAEAERKQQEKAQKDKDDAAEKSRNKQFEQKKFDRDLDFARRKRSETENAPFMPTLNEIASSSAWNRGDQMLDRFQRQQDQLRITMGMTYAASYAGQAQSLERLEDDAKRALFIEGPQSDRFKRDKASITSLKAGLAEAGLQRPDDRLESIDKHIAELLDKADKDGLKVQPANGT